MLEEVYFSGGSPLFPEGHSLHSSLVVRTMLTCKDLVEIAYFSSKKFTDICIHCGSSGDLLPTSEEWSRKFSVRHWRRNMSLRCQCWLEIRGKPNEEFKTLNHIFLLLISCYVLYKNHRRNDKTKYYKLFSEDVVVASSFDSLFWIWRTSEVLIFARYVKR